MAKRDEVLQRIRDLGIVAVVRGRDTAQVLQAVRALVAGGVRGIEVTFTVPEPVNTIEKVNAEFGEDICLGAGTVLTTEDALSAIDVGAIYIVSPGTNAEIIRLCNEEDIAVMPGAMTPTEVITAYQFGADVVKLFPAGFLGIPYLKALRGPFPNIAIIPTGGVSVDNAGEWLAAGAFALGAGSSLVLKDAMAEGQYDRITERAREFVAAIHAFRAGAGS